jgi:hypothetical protein
MLAAATNRPVSREEVLTAIRQMYSERVRQLKRYFEERPEEAVPEMANLTEKDWLDAVQNDHHRIDPEGRRLVSRVRSHSQIRFGMSELWSALTAYGKANGAAFPESILDLKPYFKSPVDDSLLANWAIVPGNELPQTFGVKDTKVITQRAPVDPENDQRIVVGMNATRLGNGTNQWGPP